MSNSSRNPFELTRGYQTFVLPDGAPPPKLCSDLDPALAGEYYECWCLQFERYCSKFINSRSKNNNPYAIFALDLCCLWERPEGLANPDWTGPISIPSSLAEFQAWKTANPGRYTGKGDVEFLHVRQGIVGNELEWRGAPIDYPNPPNTQDELKEVFMRIFFPGHNDFDTCFEAENLAAVRKAVAVAGGTFISLAQAQDKTFVRKGELPSARAYIQQLAKLVEDPVKKPGFYRFFAIIRTFTDGSYNHYSIKSKMDLVRSQISDNLKDHSNKPVTIGHTFGKVVFAEPERWSPLLELITFLLAIAGSQEAELTKVLESLSEKVNIEFGEIDISTLLVENNMKFIISQFIRNRGMELPVLCPEKWQHSYHKSPEKPMSAYKSVCSQQEQAMKDAFRQKDSFNSFGNRGAEKKKPRGYLKHTVNEINSSEDLFTDPRTGKTYKEIKSLQVKKDEVARVKPHKLIYISKAPPATKYRNRLNKAIKGLSNKTFSSKKPKAEITVVWISTRCIERSIS